MRLRLADSTTRLFAFLAGFVAVLSVVGLSSPSLAAHVASFDESVEHWLPPLVQHDSVVHAPPATIDDSQAIEEAEGESLEEPDPEVRTLRSVVRVVPSRSVEVRAEVPQDAPRTVRLTQAGGPRAPPLA